MPDIDLLSGFRPKSKIRPNIRCIETEIVHNAATYTNDLESGNLFSNRVKVPDFDKVEMLDVEKNQKADMVSFRIQQKGEMIINFKEDTDNINNNSSIFKSLYKTNFLLLVKNICFNKNCSYNFFLLFLCL